jgi:hypothetical protein
MPPFLAMIAEDREKMPEAEQEAADACAEFGIGEHSILSHKIDVGLEIVGELDGLGGLLIVEFQTSFDEDRLPESWRVP